VQGLGTLSAACRQEEPEGTLALRRKADSAPPIVRKIAAVSHSSLPSAVPPGCFSGERSRRRSILI